ncbi:Uncharacterised protein [Ralstonia mannitolilytica]|nr:YtxH domain-containing protein [Ralstonia mannitolilytica]SUD94257.1 Uncharacterised protein [Ralstonia mannitolilytica]
MTNEIWIRIATCLVWMTVIGAAAGVLIAMLWAPADVEEQDDERSERRHF